MKIAIHIYRFVIAAITALILLFPAGVRADISDSLESRLKYLGDHPDDKEAIKDVAFLYMNVGNYTEARKYARRLLDMAKATGDRDFCELYGLIVSAASSLDEDAGESFRQLEAARLIAVGSGNQDAMLSINNGFGMYYLLVHNDAYTSTSYYYDALENAKAINDRRRYGIVLSNLSGAYLLMNDVSGRKLAEQSHAIAEKRGEPVPLYYAKCALIHFDLLADSLDRVDKLIGEIETLHREGGFKGEPNLYLLRGMVADRRGDIRTAYNNYAEAMMHFPDVDASEVSATYLAYARLLRRDTHLQSAIKVLEHGLENSNSSEMKIHKPEITKELVLCYRDAGDYSKALDYSLLYQTYQDSIFNISRERALQENRIRHEVYANERLIDEQQMELLSSRHKITVLLVCIIAVFVLFALTYANYRKKNRLYRAIVSQNSEFIVREKLLLEQVESLKSRKNKPDLQVSAPLPENKANDLMMRFTTLMMEQKLFCDPSITVGGVAETLATNRTYLSRAINESTGKTFTQVVNEYRIREAIARITDLEANIPLKQICFDVGFSALSTFYSTFQTITGMTPARYRSNLKQMES